MRALVFQPPPPQRNGIYFGNNVNNSDIALHSEYYVQISDSIEKNIGGYVLRKPNVRSKLTILNSLIVPKNLKGGPFGIFKHLLCSKISKTIEGGPFGTIKKFSKKSLLVPKKIQVKNTQIAKVGILSCFQGSGRRFHNFG